jgi:hypothetical protein
MSNAEHFDESVTGDSESLSDYGNTMRPNMKRIKREVFNKLETFMRSRGYEFSNYVFHDRFIAWTLILRNTILIMRFSEITNCHYTVYFFDKDEFIKSLQITTENEWVITEAAMKNLLDVINEIELKLDVVDSSHRIVNESSTNNSSGHKTNSTNDKKGKSDQPVIEEATTDKGNLNKTLEDLLEKAGEILEVLKQIHSNTLQIIPK